MQFNERSYSLDLKQNEDLEIVKALVYGFDIQAALKLIETGSQAASTEHFVRAHRDLAMSGQTHAIALNRRNHPTIKRAALFALDHSEAAILPNGSMSEQGIAIEPLQFIWPSIQAWKHIPQTQT